MLCITSAGVTLCNWPRCFLISPDSGWWRKLFVSGDPLERIAALREPQRLSYQLSTLLAAEIVSGRIGVGEAFPSSEEIVNRFGVSRSSAPVWMLSM